MRTTPLIRPIGTDTFFNSFILNSFCVAITATIAIQMRAFLDEKKKSIFKHHFIK